jgi:hypothetical protein
MSAQHGLDFLSLRIVRTTALPAILLLGLAVGPRLVVAQSQEVADSTARVGDLWIYDTKNEVTGFPAQGYTEILHGCRLRKSP